jgi:pimeloyl-ACP methyl ester carboxylesterase
VTRFVLVPGAGGVAWYWHLVARALDEAGHEARPVDLPGDDGSAGLAEYSRLVAGAVGHHGDVVLVAQSMGGFTLPLAYARRPVRQIVLVNAMIPSPGETAADWWADTGAVEARLAAATEVGYPSTFDVFTYFLHDVPRRLAVEGEPHQRQEADIAFADRCTFDAWPDVATRVIAGADDRFLPVELQQRVARERLGLEAEVMPGGHLLALSRPQELVERLLAYRDGPD